MIKTYLKCKYNVKIKIQDKYILQAANNDGVGSVSLNTIPENNKFWERKIFTLDGPWAQI